MKALGADIKEFFLNCWPASYYHEDSEIEFTDDSGNWILDDAAKYDLTKCGVLVGECANDGKVLDFQSAFNAWAKKRGKKTLVASVPVARMDEIASLLKTHGIEVQP